ncbi:MAG: TetR/AcrR family transcriptional regulator [Clostridiales bacterium]|nr:TetR/AcrR family transcriptional regulator [Clostridiales bacterium]
MARNKYPEETYQKILDVSLQLFMTKGYDKTSLNDIINQLGGLTKGAIYYHFNSKEDILIAVINQLCNSHNARMYEIAKEENLTAAQKLEKMYSFSLADDKQEKVFSITPNLLDNPTFLAYYIKTLYTDIIPHFIVPLMKEGVEDGSIRTKYPEELGDLIMFLSDVWMNPLILEMTPGKISQKILLFNELIEPFGLHLLDQSAIKRMEDFIRFSKRE